MTDEPDNVVLRMLRDIRAKLDKLDEHDTRFDGVDRRLDKIDKTLELMKYQIAQSLGLAMAANLAATHTGERVDSLEDRQKRLDEGMAEIRRRMAEMEARLDG